MLAKEENQEQRKKSKSTQPCWEVPMKGFSDHESVFWVDMISRLDARIRTGQELRLQEPVCSLADHYSVPAVQRVSEMSLLVEGHFSSHMLSFWGDFMRGMICLKGSAGPRSKVTARFRTMKTSQYLWGGEVCSRVFYNLSKIIKGVEWMRQLGANSFQTGPPLSDHVPVCGVKTGINPNQRRQK